MPTVGFNLCKNAGHLKNVNKVSTGCLVPEHELTTAAKRALRQMQWEAMKTGLMDWIKGIRVVHTLYKLAMADEIEPPNLPAFRSRQFRAPSPWERAYQSERVKK